MRLTQVAKTACADGKCPTIFMTDRDTVIVQGYVVAGPSAGVTLPDGEALVEIPRGLLAEGAAGLEVTS